MRQWIVRLAALVLTVAFVVGTAWAGEIAGTIKTVDLGERMFVLEDGTQLFVPEGASLEGLSEGKKVKAAYEEKDGKNWVTSIEVVSE